MKSPSQLSSSHVFISLAWVVCCTVRSEAEERVNDITLHRALSQDIAKINIKRKQEEQQLLLSFQCQRRLWSNDWQRIAALRFPSSLSIRWQQWALTLGPHYCIAQLQDSSPIQSKTRKFVNSQIWCMTVIIQLTYFYMLMCQAYNDACKPPTRPAHDSIFNQKYIPSLYFYLKQLHWSIRIMRWKQGNDLMMYPMMITFE